MKKFCIAALAATLALGTMITAQAADTTDGTVVSGTSKRSTNGGGENSPMLEGQDDLYRMFLDEIRMEV